MQLAVISDIHGNCFALDEVLVDIRRQGIERIVCLGDAIQGGVQPAETVERLREVGCPIVMGNADAWLLTGLETSPHEQVTEQQLAVRAWSLAQLSKEDRPGRNCSVFMDLLIRSMISFFLIPQRTP